MRVWFLIQSKLIAIEDSETLKNQLIDSRDQFYFYHSWIKFLESQEPKCPAVEVLFQFFVHSIAYKVPINKNYCWKSLR